MVDHGSERASATDLLPRLRLLATFAARFDRRLVTIVGGPGIGKTSLLASAVAENRVAPRGVDRWVTCRPGDADARRLAGKLLAALGAADDPVDEAAGPGALAQAVADAVWHQAPRQVALLLDDTHQVPAGSPGAALLDELLERLPDNGHLVLASRGGPTVRRARLAATGQEVELGERDLRFTPSEVEAFAARRGVDPSVLAGADGWPAVVELSARAGRPLVQAYLWDEVLSGLSPARRRLLALLAELGPLDDELVAAVAGEATTVAQAVEGLPLVTPQDDGRVALHDLWRAALGDRASAEERSAAVGAATRLFVARGDLGRAMALAVETGDEDVCRSVLAAACRLGTMSRGSSEVVAWLPLLPDTLSASIEGQLLAALAGLQVDAPGAGVALRAAQANARASGQVALELVAIGQRWAAAFRAEDAETFLELSARVRELEIEGHGGAASLGALASCAIALVAGDDESAAATAAAIDGSRLHGDQVPVAHWLEAMLALDRGDVEAVRRWGTLAARSAAPSQVVFFQASETYGRWFGGDVDAVADELVAQLGGSTTTSHNDAVAAANGAHLVALLGHVDAARTLLQVARRASHQSGLLRSRLAVAEATVAVAGDDEEHAAAGLLGSELAVHPVSRPSHTTNVHRRNLALLYVLQPGTRATWDAAPLGPAWVVARSLARAIVAARGGAGPAAYDLLSDLDPGVVRAHLPQRWVVELAVAASVERPDVGQRLLEAVGASSRPILRGLAANRTGGAGRRSAAQDLLVRVPRQPAHAVELDVLGTTELRLAGAAPDTALWRRERVRTLALWLLLHPGASREAAAAALWPDFDEGAAGRNLRVTLSYLGKVLEPDRDQGDAPYFVRQDSGRLRLEVGRWFHVDRDRFDALLDEAAEAERHAAPAQALVHYLRAVALHRGQPLADVPFADWATAERDRLQSRFVHAAVRAGDLLVASGRPEEAIDVARRAADADRFDEAAFRLLAEAHLAMGDRAGARRALDRCHAMLADLGWTASPESEAVARRLADPPPRRVAGASRPARAVGVGATGSSRPRRRSGRS